MDAPFRGGGSGADINGDGDEEKDYRTLDNSSEEELLWPIVIVFRLGLFLVTIPALDAAAPYNGRAQAIQLPCVTAALTFLGDFVDFLRPHYAHNAAKEGLLGIDLLHHDPSPHGAQADGQERMMTLTAKQLAEVQCFLSSVLPFGTPIETNADVIARYPWNFSRFVLTEVTAF